MDRVTAPVETALKTAAMTIDLMDQLIIVGGGTSSLGKNPQTRRRRMRKGLDQSTFLQKDLRS